MVDEDQVKKVADNARLNVEESEIEAIAADFNDILEMFDALDEVDTSDVEPAFHPVEIEPETREDQVEGTLAREEVFANTENEEDHHFKGPSV